MIEYSHQPIHPPSRILVTSRPIGLILAQINLPFGVLETVHQPDQLFTHLSNHVYQLLIIDLALGRPAAFWDRLAATAPGLPVLVLADPSERVQAVEQLRRGAADYLLLPVEKTELLIKIQHLLEWQRLKSGMNHVASTTRGDDLYLLHQAAQAMSHTWQIDDLIALVLEKACQVAAADGAVIYLADRSENLPSQNFVVYSPAGDTNCPLDFSQPELTGFCFRLAQAAALSQGIIHRQKVIGPQISAQNWPAQWLQTILFMPMISRHKLVGVLGLTRCREGDFATDQKHWLSVFCDQAAIAIENTNLFASLASAYIHLAQSREQIQNSHNTLQALFEGISDGLYILDQELTIMALNRVEAEHQGGSPSELVGQSCLSLGWAQAAPELLRQIREVLTTGRAATWLSPENETEPYLKDREFRIYPIRNRLAQTEQVIVFGQDISERRRWQASLFRSANLAAVGQLAGSMAHQINNPLTVTMANSQLLMRESDPESEIYDLSSGIFKAGARIQNIVENLLGFSNQESYFFVETDLVETIEGALALVARSLQKDRVELVKDFQIQPLLVASVSHLKLVWMNLLLNARDAVVGYTDRPKIVIYTEMVSKREVKVVITDNGLGLTPKDFERLFQPFYTTKAVSKALGLGLYAAHAIIERHRGYINVVSQPGAGAVFEVVLPLDNPRDG